jgi:signal transduction histidine kinase
VAIDIYRIAQECLTNAVRHGSPTQVELSVERAGGGGETIALTVEDDGGGDAARIESLGIRERVAARGGSLSIGKAASGMRVSAIIPLIAPAPAHALGGAPA